MKNDRRRKFFGNAFLLLNVPSLQTFRELPGRKVADLHLKIENLRFHTVYAKIEGTS